MQQQCPGLSVRPVASSSINIVPGSYSGPDLLDLCPLTRAVTGIGRSGLTVTTGNESSS